MNLKRVLVLSFLVTILWGCVEREPIRKDIIQSGYKNLTFFDKSQSHGYKKRNKKTTLRFKDARGFIFSSTHDGFCNHQYKIDVQYRLYTEVWEITDPNRNIEKTWEDKTYAVCTN